MHELAIVMLGVSGLYLAWGKETRRVGLAMVATALVCGAVDVWAADPLCNPMPRGYWTIADTGSGNEGEHTAGEGSMSIYRDSVRTGNDEMIASVVTDANSWGTCGGVEVAMTYSVSLTGVCFGIPQAGVWYGPFEDDCTGIPGPIPCHKQGTVAFTIHPGDGTQVGMWVVGTCAGFTDASLSGPFPIVPPRFSRDTKRTAAKVSSGLGTYAFAASAGAGLATMAGQVGIAKALGASAAATGAISTGIDKVLKYDPWDATTTVYKPARLPMPSGVPSKYRPWIRNELEIQRWWSGVVVALDRANTAFALGNLANQSKQIGAIATYTATLDGLMAKNATYRTQFAADFAPYDVDLDEPTLIASLQQFTP